MNKYPEWVRWIAKDEDGKCWAYEAEPHQFHKGWYENEIDRYVQVNCPLELNDIAWQEGLISIEKTANR